MDHFLFRCQFRSGVTICLDIYIENHNPLINNSLQSTNHLIDQINKCYQKYQHKEKHQFDWKLSNPKSIV